MQPENTSIGEDYLIPVIFAFGDLLGSSIIDILFDFVTLFFMFSLMPMAIEGYYLGKRSVPERIILGLGAIGLFMGAIGPIRKGLPWLLMGVAVSVVSLIWMHRKPATGKATLSPGNN